MSNTERNTGEMIQQELERMARNVPEMPAAFREGWRQAIRLEAAKTAQAPDSEAASSEKAAAEIRPAVAIGDESAQARKNAFIKTRRWAGILSAAAAMVILIGGTLATRNTLSPRLHREEAVQSISGEAQDSENMAMFAMPVPESEAPTAMPTMVPPDPQTSGTLFQDADDMAGGEARSRENVLSEETAAQQSINSTKTFGVSEKAQESTFDFAREEETQADALDAGEIPEAETADDLLEETEDSEEAAGEEMSSDAGMANLPAASPDFKTEVVWFLEDMGAFLQAAWPWLAGAAVLALSIPGVQKLLNHRKNQ